MQDVYRECAISSDLRWCMVYPATVCVGALLRGSGKATECRPTTVSRTVQLLQLSTIDKFAIMAAVLDNSSMYLHEMQHLHGITNNWH